MARRRAVVRGAWAEDEGKKVRTERAERGLLTVFKAVALKITQASSVEPPSHHTAPQDSSTAGNHQVANEGEDHRHLHLLSWRLRAIAAR